MPDLHAELFCDPFTPGTWRFRPLLTHVSYAFSEVDWTVRPIAAIPEPLTDDEAARHRRASVQAAQAAGLPLADSAFKDRVPASWEACEALVGVRDTSPDTTRSFLDRITTQTFGRGDPPTDADELAALAAQEGVDPEPVREAVGSRRATAAVGRDIERAIAAAATLPQHEVRGDPQRDVLGTRLLGDGRSEPADSSYDADHSAAGSADSADRPGTPVLAGMDTAVLRTPIVRLYAGDYTVVVDPRRGFQEFTDVLRRYDADIGDLDWSAKLHGRHVMTAYGISQRTAEHLSSEQYGDKVIGILEDLGPAYVAEVAACADLDPDTCRLALGNERVDGRVAQTDAGIWHLSNRTD